MSEFIDYDGELARLLGPVGYRSLCAIVPHVRDRLESPLERMFVDGLERVGFSVGPKGKAWRFPDAGHGSTYVATPQIAICGYRCDFMFSDARGTWRFAVECDGHTYHERTAEQASRDRKRDRVFQTNGVSVLRFTGEEIRSDRRGCAVEALEFCRRKQACTC